MDNKRKLSFKRASFMKILEDSFINKLPIPPAFAKIFEECIPPWLILEIAGTRKCWRVDIEEDGNGRMYLSCGFDCFVKAHSLEAGNFLLFELEEPSILQVKIYEKDGSEKAVGTTFETAYEGNAFESPRRTPIIHQGGESSPWSTMPSVQYEAYEKQQNAIGGNKRKKGIVSATEHGLCFSVTWRNANHFIYYLTIPKAMLSGKILSNKDRVILQNRDGNSWPVELKMRPDGRMDLHKGWRQFVEDNNLTTGDTLILEFVSNNVIQVHVKRAFQVGNPPQSGQDCQIEDTQFFNMACENEELAANYTTEYNTPVTVAKTERFSSELIRSSFAITWTQKTRNSYLHIPKAIANKQKLEHKDTVVLCDPEGKQWLMEVRTRQSDGRVGVGRGWADFAKAYGIGVGDTLIFEFVTDRMMKVHVIKASTEGTIKQELLQLD